MRCLLALVGSWLVATAGGSAAGAPPPPPPGVATVEFLDVGQGDATLIRSPEGKTALVDAGPSGRVAGLLRDRGVTALDLVVVSHHHSDHYGGMAEALKEFHPRVFLDADSPHLTPHYLALLQQVRDGGIVAARPLARSRRLELGSVTLTVLPRPPTDRDEENNNSVGIRVEYGSFSALLTGDSEAAERRWWIRNAPGLCADVDVLKLAHHGSRNGTDSAWLGLTRPRLAVASLGAGNEFGHPHAETLALLRSLDVPLRRTDVAGPILIRTDGRRWSIARSTAPTRPPHAPADPGPDRAHGGPVRLNAATEEELRALPGIGPTLARRIAEGRPYRSIDDLARVAEMGRKRVERVRPFVTVD